MWFTRRAKQARYLVHSVYPVGSFRHVVLYHAKSRWSQVAAGGEVSEIGASLLIENTDLCCFWINECDIISKISRRIRYSEMSSTALPDARTCDGWMRFPISDDMVMLNIRIDVEKELWSALEYYSEVEDVGISLLQARGLPQPQHQCER